MLIAVFYNLFISQSDEIPKPKPRTTEEVDDISDSYSIEHTKQQAQVHIETETALLAPSQPPIEELAQASHPPSNEDRSVWRGIGKFFYEIIFEILFYGLLRVIWFLIKGFFILLGRILN